MKKIATVIARAAKRSAFKLKQHAPEILLGIGAVGTVASTVLACKATVKAQPVLDKAKDRLDEIHIADNDPRVSYKEYPKEQVKKDITEVYVSTAKELSKIYALPATLGLASLSCMVGSHAMVRKQLNLTLAAYTALSNSFREYRRRIEENLGVQDADLGYAEKTDKKGHFIQIEDRPSYVLKFDNTNKNWKDDIEYNLMFLKGTQRYLDYELKKYGFLCANDALKELGFDPVENGQIDIWKYDFDHPENCGEGYVSLGLFNKDGSKTDSLIAYEKGQIDYILIKLNVDQTIKAGI